MPTYAILGATGSTGQSLLSLLLQNPNNRAHVYVRSRSKLENLSPKLCANDNIQIFQGALDDIPLIASCVAHTSVVFSVIGANKSFPGMRVVQDAAHSVVAAMCCLHAQHPEMPLPKILFLSSAGINPRHNRQVSPAIIAIGHAALSYAYEDLKQAEAYLRLHKSWLNVTFIQTGGLTNDVQRGHKLTLDGTNRDMGSFISYPDVAAGMIEVAEDEGNQYNWKGVGLFPTSGDVKFNWGAPMIFVRGLVAHFVPSAYWALKRLGLVE
ncbi:MAG: hypothetical protein Q9195_005508 [Heterodermia aff. obscurata]